MSLTLNPLLDVGYLTNVYGDDATIIYMIFDAFLSDSAPRWMSLKDAVDRNDMSSAASIVHGLKPSFTMSGLTATRQKVDELEKQIKTNAELSEIRKSYDDIDKDLKTLLPVLTDESARLKTL